MIKAIKHAAMGLLFFAGTAAAQDATPMGQTVVRAGAGHTLAVPASNFTGTATVQRLVDPVRARPHFGVLGHFRARRAQQLAHPPRRANTLC